MKYLIVLILCLICFCGSVSKDPSYLPLNATEIVDKGNGWVEFILDGRRFLYYQHYVGSMGFAAITELDRE